MPFSRVQSDSEFAMHVNTTILGIGVALGAGAASAQVSVEKYSDRELRAMIRNVRTAEDCERVASLFRRRAGEFREKEREQERILQDYLANPGKYPSKYPTRGDVARQLTAYYRGKAAEAERQASNQTRLANLVRSEK